MAPCESYTSKRYQFDCEGVVVSLKRSIVLPSVTVPSTPIFHLPLETTQWPIFGIFEVLFHRFLRAQFISPFQSFKDFGMLMWVCNLVAICKNAFQFVQQLFHQLYRSIITGYTSYSKVKFQIQIISFTLWLSWYIRVWIQCYFLFLTVILFKQMDIAISDSPGCESYCFNLMNWDGLDLITRPGNGIN